MLQLVKVDAYGVTGRREVLQLWPNSFMEVAYSPFRWATQAASRLGTMKMQRLSQAAFDTSRPSPRAKLPDMLCTAEHYHPHFVYTL